MGVHSRALSRRGFMGGVGVVGVGGRPDGGAGAAGTAPMIDVSTVTTPVTNVEKLPNAYYLSNVRLETGFVEEKKAWLDAPVITHTNTGLKTLRIADGKIAEILDTKSAVPPDAASYDAQGQLMLPTFRDMHIHLDKTFYGGPWEATLPTQHGRADRVAQEREILPKLLPLAEERTAAMIRLMHSHGTTVCRSHCNVDPVSKLGNLEHLKASFERFKDTLNSQDHHLPAARPVGLRQRRSDARGAEVRRRQLCRRRRSLLFRQCDGKVGRHDGSARGRFQCRIRMPKPGTRLSQTSTRRPCGAGGKARR